MKILFATGFLEENLNANNKIVYKLAQALGDMGHICVVAGISEFSDEHVTRQGNVKKVYLNSTHICDRAMLAIEQFTKKRNLPREKRRKLFSVVHPIYAMALYYKYNKAWGMSFSLPSYEKQIDEIITKWQPDVVVVSYSPAGHALAAAKANRGRSKLISYQLDPWGLHYGSYFDRTRQENIKNELSLFDMSDYIVTTPVLLSQYKKSEQYAQYTDKMLPLDFPCFEKPENNPAEKSVFSFDKEDINILFSGTINDDNRNPRFLLSLLQKAKKRNDRIKVYFLGNSDSAILKDREKENSWIICHDNVSPQAARSTAKECGVLLNISNIYDNQVPSKIFEYFATGKPLLNVEKIKNCPARPYIDRYELSFTICEWDDNADTEQLADRLCKFLENSRNMCVDYKSNEEIFHNCTVEYACGVFDGLFHDIKF